jgi:hypothetical protein
MVGVVRCLNARIRTSAGWPIATLSNVLRLHPDLDQQQIAARDDLEQRLARLDDAFAPCTVSPTTMPAVGARMSMRCSTSCAATTRSRRSWMLDWTSRRPVTTSLRNAFCFWMISSFVSPISAFARAMFAARPFSG